MSIADPKIATQGQWEDLASRVKAKAEIGTVLSTPTSVAYVDTANIVDGAVTSSKIDYTTLKKWIPDYDQKSSTNLWANSETATMAEDGFVACSASVYKVDANVTVEISINGVAIFKSAGEARNPSSAVMAPIWGLLPVVAGDIVSISTTASNYNYKTCYFIPGKWV